MTPLWLHRHSPEGEKRIICFPPAAGRADQFRSWLGLLGDGVELWTVILPGRDRRMHEPLERDAGRIADAVTAELTGLPPKPAIVFGHSVGAFLAYETALRMTAGGAPPKQLAVAAMRAPQVPPRPPFLHKIPRIVLVEALRRMGGTPDEVLATPELMDMFEPIIRADAALSELYPVRAREKLSCPVVAFVGGRDPVIHAPDMAGWAELTTGPHRSVTIDGDHFFPREGSFAALLRRELRWD